MISEKRKGFLDMICNNLSIQELGSSKLLVYKGDVEYLNFHSNIPNILTFVRTTFVDVPLCYFDITGKAAFNEIQKYTLDKYDLLKILKTAVTVAGFCTNGDIPINSILFDPEYVFIDKDFNAYFIPLNAEKCEKTDINKFLKDLVVNSIVDLRYTDNFVQQLLNCFNDPQFTIDNLANLVNQMLLSRPQDLTNDLSGIVSNDISKNKNIDKNMASAPSSYADTIIADMLKKELENAKKSKPVVNSGFAPNISTGFGKGDGLDQPTEAKSTKLESDSNSNKGDIALPFEEDMQPDKYSGGYEKIVQDNSNIPTKAYLVDSEDSSTRIPINYNPFRIGRNPDLVDFVINSPYVGRLHAVIIFNDGKTYVVDKSSTNGTFLNGQHLVAERESVVNNGDMIRFAKHSYQFIIE